ncbi:hypothetical protein BIW11_04770 [Tropilaelaps mercedesae]|uniref:Uncharacterized protein n=1 Tax=Tropilaelaps mercedesae TaxID=418985 RepID=A0A1V9X1K9_9ACAR|nr:hypothetical protein BIW11_04770 [Tropilaelaps mercedesae]
MLGALKEKNWHKDKEKSSISLVSPPGGLAQDMPSGDTTDNIENLGFQDRALRWVKRHAEVFGGDPSEMSVWG